MEPPCQEVTQLDCNACYGGNYLRPRGRPKSVILQLWLKGTFREGQEGPRKNLKADLFSLHIKRKSPPKRLRYVQGASASISKIRVSRSMSRWEPVSHAPITCE